MPGCKPICVEIIAGTNREKWDYVRDLYFPYRVETRLPTDAARLADEATADAQFAADELVWQTKYPTAPFERFLQWLYVHGTYQYGNIGDWKKDDHVGHCWAPCPYDLACDSTRTRHLLALEETDPLPAQSAHGIYYMRTESRGSRWGLECTDDNCPYYLSTGQRYFYV